jgi:hypothetical protein
MSKTKVPLAPVIKTQVFPRITRSGLTRPECWAAQTADGAWNLGREDSPGTPWLVIHAATGIEIDLRSTLRDCQAFIAAGHADAGLARIQAHGRGEHAARDSWCRRCHAERA